ncbi:MAG: TIR domain-containing protein [Chloroflexi bacterium]|nr:TIR domain-containing protein [Chloroflexota bacterium]
MKTYNLFVSHSWAYGNQYDRLVTLLSARPYFRFRNHSVPRYDPIHLTRSDVRLRRAIRERMAGCHAVLILAGVYSTYSKWINIEIRLALTGFSQPKPIIAIAPWGSRRTSSFVKLVANEVVGWNTESVVRAIRNHAL